MSSMAADGNLKMIMNNNNNKKDENQLQFQLIFVKMRNDYDDETIINRQQ